eukprot:539503_1
MKYQPSANEKASHAPNAQSNQLPQLPPRIDRSRSANDAASGVYGSYMYGDHPEYAKPDGRYHPYYGASGSGSATQTDPYGAYDVSGAYGYHQYAAEQAPNDEAAAYHQYHAQQAAMQHAQQQQRTQHTLAPIYDNAAYNARSANTQHHAFYNHPQPRPPPQQPQPHPHAEYPLHRPIAPQPHILSLYNLFSTRLHHHSSCKIYHNSCIYIHGFQFFH